MVLGGHRQNILFGVVACKFAPPLAAYKYKIIVVFTEASVVRWSRFGSERLQCLIFALFVRAPAG